MSYSNEFLADFTPVFKAILKEKKIAMERLELVIIDEEPDGGSIFEPADVGDVLGQLGQELNALTIYTDRPEYFEEFVQDMFEENGLVVMVFPKWELKQPGRQNKMPVGQSVPQASCSAGTQKLILDFEWEGECCYSQIGHGRSYIPIHKRPWRQAENLDIMVPFGYNTMIVKNMQMTGRKPVYDRFEEAFYRDE